MLNLHSVFASDQDRKWMNVNGLFSISNEYLWINCIGEKTKRYFCFTRHRMILSQCWHKTLPTRILYYGKYTRANRSSDKWPMKYSLQIGRTWEPNPLKSFFSFNPLRRCFPRANLTPGDLDHVPRKGRRSMTFAPRDEKGAEDQSRITTDGTEF